MTIPIQDIAERLKDERCLILLGPRVAINKQGQSVQKELLGYIKTENPDLEIEIASNQDFLVYLQLL